MVRAGEGLVEAIRNSDSFTEEQKNSLIARATAAHAKAMAYEPKRI